MVEEEGRLKYGGGEIMSIFSDCIYGPAQWQFPVNFYIDQDSLTVIQIECVFNPYN